ncbi:lipase 1-like [Plodia interpunctella]|uniref:lipase 1-like n=1 Tax=Plodia interpunctella TaxID=58824 RepID=UPI002368A671|nr:lipase 1-like [Plodia interpunctella]
MVLLEHIVYFVMLYLNSAKSLSVDDKLNIPDSKLNFTELANKYGYISEEYKFPTDDGYILTIFRMRRKACELKMPPVILMHGLLLTADSFVDAGPGSGLAYLLADDCQDVWVGNCRGSYYSRAHEHLNPDKDQEFWNYSVDEIGYYDIPATVDFVLGKTGLRKLNYIGFSQGAATIFVMCSERPGYCDKLNAFIGLAPAARHTNSKSIAFRVISTKLWKLEGVLTKSGVYEVFGKEYREFFTEFCNNDDATNFCLTLLWILDSSHPNSILDTTVKTLVGHFPSGTSVKSMARCGQSVATENFQKFDYGVDNIKVYGSENPPKYNLSASTMPVMLIYGQNDGLVDPVDVEWLVSKLPNVVDVSLVPDPKWTHLDNVYSSNIAGSMFPKIREYLLRYNTEYMS